MADRIKTALKPMLQSLPDDRPILIAGPTASGKSALALEIAQTRGGVIVNADASQVYDCWRVLTARPSVQEEALAPHALYGHVSPDAAYSTGHWLRDVTPFLTDGPRPIIVGGTGLYFSALTRGLANIPATPPEIRAEADNLSLDILRAGVDAATLAGLDQANRARVQRAWEVQRATGRGLSDWQADTGAPALRLADCAPLVLHAQKDWLNARIARRFDKMIAEGALEEATALRPHYDPSKPAHRAIGAPELMAHIDGKLAFDDARDAVVVATRQFAKRQRTWFRSKMRDWRPVPLPE